VGCPFHPRCDSAFARCSDQEPVLRDVGDAHTAACHLNDVPAQVAQ